MKKTEERCRRLQVPDIPLGNSEVFFLPVDCILEKR